MRRVKRVCIYSDSPRNTSSYAIMTEKFGNFLVTNGYEVSCIANFDKNTGKTTEINFPIFVSPNIFTRERWRRILLEIDPDVVFVIGDPDVCYDIIEYHKFWKPMKYEVIWTIGQDYDPLPRVSWVNSPYAVRTNGRAQLSWIKLFEQCVKMCTYTRSGIKMLEDAGLGDKAVRTPLGVDSNIFKPYPIGEKNRLRAEFYTEEGKQLVGTNDFLVACVARNSFRKNIPILIKAFSILTKKMIDNGMPKPHLYLHTAIDDFVGYNLSEIIDRCGLGFDGYNNVMHPDLNIDQGVEEKTLCDLYNTFDLVVCPSMREGFNLSLLEAMACNIPWLATDKLAYVSEFATVNGEGAYAIGGDLIKVGNENTVDPSGLTQYILDLDDLVDKMWLYATDKEYWKKKSQEGRLQAKRYSWSKTFNLWKQLIDDIEIDKPEERRILNSAVIHCERV